MLEIYINLQTHATFSPSIFQIKKSHALLNAGSFFLDPFFSTAGTTSRRDLTRGDRRHRPETFASQDGGFRLVGLLRLLASNRMVSITGDGPGEVSGHW